MEWSVTQKHRREVQERTRRERWAVKTISQVTHPAHGSVVVPHRSNLSAILNAAEVWGCGYAEIKDAKVMQADPGASPVPMPHTTQRRGTSC